MLYDTKSSEDDALYKSMRGLTHTLKGTVGLIRAVAASDLVQPRARNLLEQVAKRIQDSYQTLDEARGTTSGS